MRHARATNGRQRPGMLMLGLLALCALLGGGSIAQTHVHPLHPPMHLGVQDGTDRSASVSTPDEDCALCDALAAFEPLLPDDPTVATPVAMAAALMPIGIAAAYPLPAARGHGWRSRAPPLTSPT